MLANEALSTLCIGAQVSCAVLFYGMIIGLPFYFRRRRRISRERLTKALDSPVSQENLVANWQLNRDVVYRYELVPIPFRRRENGRCLIVERVLAKDVYLVRTNHCRRPTQYVIRDQDGDYVRGDVLSDGFYKCVGRYIGEWADVRLLERVRLCPELERLRLRDFR